jgi:tetratricopeptide (TPR) repeat protein
MTNSLLKSSPLFRTFKEIEPDGSRSVLRFVEEHAQDISMLPVREYFGLQYAYCAALYETGNYRQVVECTKELLELSIMHNLNEVDGEDAFRTLLFRRASSLFHLMSYDECIHICDQLLRLHPQFLEAGQLYEKALYQKPIAWIAKARALSVALFLSAATLIAFEVLVINQFAEATWRTVFEYCRNGCFLLGWLMLLGGDIAHRTWAWSRVKHRRSKYASKRASRN